MERRALAAALAALVVANLDLLLKATLVSDARFDHHRSTAWVAVSCAELGLMALLTLLPSRAVALSAALVAGGTLGNLVSALANADRVPNPFVVHFAGGGVAFNAADAAFVGGQVLLTVAAMRLAIRHRHRLPRSTVAVRLARKLAG